MLEVYQTVVLAFIIGFNFSSLGFLIMALCSHYVKSMVNPNMKIVTIAWLTGLFSMSFGLFGFANYSIFVNNLDYSEDWKPGAFARLFLLYGAFLFRFSVFGAVVERGVATFMMRKYTRNILRSIVICLYLIILPALQLIAYYRFNLTKIKLTAQVFTIDTVSLTVCLLIRHFNKKLRRRRLHIELSLAERYQINENIRFLHVILPSAFANWFYCLILGFGYVVDALGVTIEFNSRMLGTHVGYSLLVLLSLFIPCISDGFLVRKVLCFAPVLKERLFTIIVHPQRNVVNRTDTNVYFSAYQKSWNTVK